MFIAILLIYTGIFVPIRIAFIEETTQALLIWETFVDLCFIIDMVLTFITAYEYNDQVETRPGRLASNYLKGWFWIDLLSTIPF